MIRALAALSLLILLVRPAQCHVGTLRVDENEKEAEQLAKEAFGTVLSTLLVGPEKFNNDLDRKLQIQYVPCNTVIQTLTADEIRTMVMALMQEQTNLPEAAIFTLDNVVLGRLKYDVQLWKVCGRCSDFEDDSLYPKDIACRPQDYGYNAMHSGLLVAPYDAVNDRLIPRTLPVNIVPATAVEPPSETSIPIREHPALLGALVTSVTRAYSLLPDHIGRAESSEYYRAFLIKQSVITSVVPLIWQSEKLVAEQSDCTSAMANAYSLAGYSQGGYAVIAIADVLQRMGKHVMAVSAGGAPYQLSSETLTYFVRTVNSGRPAITFFITLVAAGLSSTTTDALNYGTGQDFLASDQRDEFVARVQTVGLDRDPINELIPYNDPLSIYNEHLIAMVEGAISRGESHPCVTSVNNQTDKICLALQDLDLLEELDRAEYPIQLCHSIEDENIPFSNIPPDITTRNPNIRVKTVSGSHWEATMPCVIDSIFYAVNPFNLKWYRAEGRTFEGGCEAGTPKNCNVWRRLFIGC
ncbi:expressed unknown protein [Seminavis robusta]|uniref:Uncharacterized protein n=1 Tax=Seminavis robusta TaxID=568900 RepID=A0A9N8H7G0_9STRA|nr:expressed unknown protein [Seminavis robusta]|eukprot:Sro67_g037700.1 n/a (525) ;mRNA; f:102288-103862